MSFELSQLFIIGIGYLLLLFGIAHIADRGWIPEQLIRHPLTYVLSLGVFASAWSIYGVVGLAHEYGYGFLSYYLGVAGTFIFAPLLLLPLLRIARTYLHSSLADVLTFRYRTQWAGSLMTLFMVFAVWPLLALQIQAVADSLHILTTISAGDDALFTKETRHNELAFIFCLAICLFTISFGSKHLTAHERHNGLVAAIAFESVIKLIAMLVVGLAAVYQVFGGFDGMDQWLTANPQIVSLLNFPMREDSSRALLLIFFSAAVAMPHLFHMIFAENPNVKAMLTASWGVPLFLMLMSLPVLPILWAGFKLETVIPPEYFTLAIGIELESSALAILVYLGGLSAASGAVIVTTLALASMCLKHLILPVYRPSTDRDIYRWLLWIRRILIVCIILTGYAFYRFIAGREALSSLGLAAFIGTLQFFPGVLAALYWQGANRKGFIAGLITGFAIWFVTLLLPIITSFDPTFIGKLYFSLVYDDLWSAVTIVSLGMNMLVFGVVSVITSTSEEEKNAAEVCATDDLNRPTRRLLSVQSPEQMKDQLATALGQRTAQREVDRALYDMQMSDSESRPFALRRLRYRVEANLSGLLGPSVAHDMVNQLLPYESGSSAGSGEDINLIEGQLENYKVHLTGLAADLDNLRRYHRQTLQDLPVGVCSLGQDGEILMWNNAIANFTGISTFDVIGSSLRSLPKPWGELLADFVHMPQAHLYKQHYEDSGSSYWFNLHKTLVDAEGEQADGRVIVLEDTTDVQMLEDELMHSERLASIGRLAAGVAHEIGNPVTGIACLAQNLRYDTDNPESLETGREILVQTERVSKIVQTLVNFAHSGTESASHELGPVHIKSCVEEAIHLLHLNKEAKQMRFENQCEDELYAIGDTQRLLQVFVNLLSNARDASPEQSAVVVDTELRNQQVYINVTDCGSGISKEHQEQIFDPFFTTKEAGEGTGLGLSLVYSIVDDLNGNISVESPADPVRGGTRFTLRLYHHQQG
ncbi:sensor histidine kinase [Oceanicoccus sagamiensis]|uniref:histidine kinase n=1 Tax=Oceanicoccus sagamiensis TaxID=716816 RepID=A0A1X9N8S9_9GAMM|nr:sensor histidine kinase [Oceanicoccus sagamiensis]ARN73494.1 ATPase [Oceanicoccus sagamiensis]